jgi:hypothetical protein
MFRDIRLGTDGNIPTETNLAEFYRLSTERCLYLRLTSPHEAKLWIGRKAGRRSGRNFLEKTPGGWRKCCGDMPRLRPALKSAPPGGIQTGSPKEGRRRAREHRMGADGVGTGECKKVAKLLFLFALQYLSYFRCELAYDIRKRTEYSLCHHRLVATSPGVVASWLPR